MGAAPGGRWIVNPPAARQFLGQNKDQKRNRTVPRSMMNGRPQLPTFWRKMQSETAWNADRLHTKVVTRTSAPPQGRKYRLKFMSAHSVRHQYRHYRTLIALVLAMTGGTMVLFWLGRFSPVTPLRSTAAMNRPWTQISVRAEDGRGARGFFHYRIDETGRLFQSYAWKAGQPDRATPKTIHVLLSCGTPDAKVTDAQARTLTRVISQIRSEHDIAADRVFVEAAKGIADRGESGSSRLRRT